MSYISLLPHDVDGKTQFLQAGRKPDRWDIAHQYKLIGGWELIPFHSEKDGLTSFVWPKKLEHLWIGRCATATIKAAIRAKPEVLLIASKAGWSLIRLQMHPDWKWKDYKIGGATVSYFQSVGTRSEFIAINRQLSAHGLSAQNVIKAVKKARRRAASKVAVR